MIQNPASISPTRDWKDVVRLQPMLPDLPSQARGLPPTLVMTFRMALAGTDDFPTTGISCLRPGDRSASLSDSLIGQGTNPLQADRFFLDLRHQDPVEAGHAIMEHLNNRSDTGVSLILLKGDPNDPQIAAMREELGRTFGIESSCHIKPELAQTEDGEGLVAIAVGERRPKALPSATGVALRLMVAELPQDLHQWYLVDVRTGRQRIHELHSGKEPEILQQRQAPYRSMGRYGQVSSMIPRGHQVALNRAQQKFRNQYGDDVLEDYCHYPVGAMNHTSPNEKQPEVILTTRLWQEWREIVGRTDLASPVEFLAREDEARKFIARLAGWNGRQLVGNLDYHFGEDKGASSRLSM